MTTPAEFRSRLSLHRVTLRRNLELLHRFAKDFDDAASRTPIVPGGSHFAWLLAHLAVARDAMLERLGAERVWDAAAAERYKRGSDAAAHDPPPIEEILRTLDRQGERLASAMQAVDDAALAAPEGSGSVSDRLEFLIWHETYHLGQGALYRRAAGLESPIG
ncbi:MAG: DinB family protein [Trueperaceae bacterium]|nr:DinB family protein [Trueperaceae bacterium]